MELFAVIVLAAVQGLTEFLPISSSGHLTIAQQLLEVATGSHLPDPLGLNIVLHAGTLVAILIVYWRPLVRLVREDRRVLSLLAVGTLPAAVVGVPLHRFASGLLTDPLLAGALLPVTGLMLLWAARQPAGELSYQQVSHARAFWIGLFQALALLPGISRSGATIAAGLAVGLRREAAASFSFLLAIPAIAGACLLELAQTLADQPLRAADLTASVEVHQPLPLAWLALGGVLSMLVGLVALVWLLRWLRTGRLHYFAYWCIPLGLATVIWQLAL